MFLERLEDRALLAALVWDGSSSVNWADAANWVGDIAPAAGDDLFFPAGAANLTNTNNLPAGTSFNTILFTGGGYNITGNAITLAGGLTANNVAGNNSFLPAMTLGNAVTLMSANVGTTLTLGAIDTQNILGATNIQGNSALALDGSGTLVISGVISGQGSIEKLGAGTAALQGANTYTGLTDVRQGFLRVENAAALGAANGAETQIQAGAQLQAAGTFTIAENIALREAGVGFGNGTNPGTMGALRGVSGAVTWSGNMDMAGGNNLIGVDTGATLIASGAISNATQNGTTTRLLKVGGGTLRLTGTQANVYRGDTVVLQGTLELGKTAGLNAIGGSLVIGDNIGGDNAATVRLLANNQIPHIDYFGLSLNTITLNSSGLLDFNGFSDTIGNLTMTVGTTYSADIDLNGGTLTFGGATLTVNGFQGSSGVAPATTIADGTFDLGTFFSGAGGGAIKAFNVNDTQLANVAPDLVFSANITGTADIAWNKGGGGTLVLSGNNTNAGPVSLQAGLVGIGSNNAFGTGILSLQGSTLRAFGADRTVSTTVSLDGTVPVLGDLDITFTSPATLTGTRTIQVMDPASIVTFAAPIGEGIFGTLGLSKSGRGTLQFTAANTFSSTLTVNNDGGTITLAGNGSLQNVLAINVNQNGVLRLDNTGTNNGDRINNMTSIGVNGGEVILVGNASAVTSETTGPINTGDQLINTISVQNTSAGAQSVVLVANALGINGTRTINFRAVGGDLSATGPNRIVLQNNPGNLINGVLAASRTTGTAGVDLATFANAAEGIAVIPLPATGYTSDLANAGPLSNVRITTPGTYTLTRSKQINSLLLGPGVIINGVDTVLSVGTGTATGIIDFIGAGAAAINVESIILGNGSVFVDSGMTATIGGNIISANSLNKGGPGRLVLSGDNTFSTALNVNEGFVTLQRSSAAGSPAGATNVRQGATLELQQTTFGPVSVGLETLNLNGVGVSTTGQYADAVGAIRNISGNNAWAGRINLGGDATDLTGVLLLNGFPVINSGNTFFGVDTGSRLTVTGDIVNGVEVIKRGPGTLEYAGVLANSYDATTRILEGTLELNKDRGINSVINQVNVGSDRPGAPAATLKLITSDQMRDDRGAFIHSSGLLDIGQTEGFGGALVLVIAANGAGDVTIGTGGTLTTNIDVNVFTAGVGNPTGATITGGTVALQYQGIVSTAGTRNWQVNDGTTGTDLTVTSAIVDGTGLQSVGINKNYFGSLELGGTGANTYTGTTSVNEGTLLLNKGTGTGGVNALTGPILVGDTNPQSGFASSDILRLLQPNQIPDFLAAIDVRNTGLLDLNNNNETIGNVDAQVALTINGGATISTGTGTLTLNGDVTGNPAQGANIFTPVAVATINGRLNLGSLTRTINIGDRSELPAELIINADISGTAGINLNGGHTLLLNGNNTFSGDTYRSNGNWAVGSDTAFGTAKVFLNGGNLVTYNGPRALANEFNMSGATIAFLAGNGQAGSGAVGGGGNNLTMNGPITVTGGSFLPSTATAGTLDFAGTVGESMNTVFFRKQGPGTLILSSAVMTSNGFEIGQDPGGNSRYNGGTVILRGQGTLKNTNVLVGTGGVFQLDNSAGNLTNRLGDTALIDLFGGTIALVGGSGVQATESMGQLRPRNTFTGTVQVLTSPVPGSNATWRFTNMAVETANNGDAVKFVSRGQNLGTANSRVGFNTSPTLVDGIIIFAVMQNSAGYDFATFVNATPALTPFDNFLTPLTSGANFVTTLAAATATTNVRLTTSETIAGPITANALLLANGGIVVGGAGALTVDTGLLISTGAGNQINNAALTLGAAETLIFVNENSDLNISSGIAGAANSFAKNGKGLLILSNNANANSFVSTARVTEGTLRAAKDTAFGTNAGNVNVTYGATLELAGGVNIPAETLTLNGQGEANLIVYPLRNLSGVNTWQGNVALNTGRTAIDVTSGTLIIGDASNPGIVSNQGFNKFGNGTLQLAGNASNTNANQSNVWQGTLELNKNAGLFAIVQLITIGDQTNGGDNVDVVRLLQDNQFIDTVNYTITVQPSGLLDLNNRIENITPTAATTVLQLNIGSQGSADVQTGATGNLVLGGGGGAANVTVGVVSGGSPVAVGITGNVQITGTSTQFNVGDSASLEDLSLRALISGVAPILVTGNNGRTVLDPRNAANAVVPNTFDGLLTISQGEVVARSAGALGTTSGATSVATGSLLLDGVGTIANELLTLNGAGFNNEGVLRNVAGNNIWTGGITLAGTTTLSVNGGTALDISGVIGQSAAAGVNKLMPGTLTYSGTAANTYAGTTTVAEGTLILNKPASTDAFAGPLTIGNDAGAGTNLDVVQLNAANQIPDAVALTLQSTGRLNLGANNETVGAITLVGGATYAPILATTGAGVLSMNGNVTLNGAGVQFTTRAPGAVFAGNLNLNNATRTFTINDPGLGIMETVIDAAISSGGAGAITSNGAGLLVLTNNNPAYAGPTTISAGGGIVVRNNGALGTGPLNLTGASNLIVTNYGAPQSTITLPVSTVINLSADLTIRGDNNLVINGPINGLGAANRVLTVNVNNNSTVTLAGNLNLSNDATQRTFTLNDNVYNHVTNVTGFIRNGSGAINHLFTKGGNGTVIVSSNNNTAPNNDFLGNTTVNAGILRITNNSALGGGISEVQRFGVSSTGGGSFTITYNTQVTAALNYVGTTPPTSTEVANALNALPSVLRTGGVVSVVSSNPAGPATNYDITFGGSLVGIDVTQISAVTITAPVTLNTAISTVTAGSGGTFVNSPATLQVIPGLNVAEPLTLNNGGIGNSGALRLIDQTPGTIETATWSGNINFNNNAFLGVDGGGANPDRLILSGTTVSGGGLTVKTGPGELEWTGATDNGQVVFNAISAFDDGIEVRSGTVYLNKPAGFTALIGGAAVNVGDGGGGAGADRFVLMGASTDHIAGTVPLNVTPSGFFTMAGAATTESIPGAISFQRWTNGAGTIDTTATRSLILANTVNATNLGFTDGTTPAGQLLGNIDLGTASRSFNTTDSLVPNVAEDLVVPGIILSVTATSGVTKDGFGTLALTGVNTYTGTTTVNAGTQVDGLITRLGGQLTLRNAGVLSTGGVLVNEGGTLTLNNTAANANRIADAAAVDLRGVLNVIGNPAGSTETVGALTVNVTNNGGSPAKISVDSSAGGVTELQLASLARGGSATLELEGVGANLGSTTNSRIQVLGGTSPFVNNVMTWATMRGPAGYDLVTDADGNAGTAPYFLSRVTAYNTDINLGGIVRLTGGAHTLAATTTVHALLIEGGATVTGANVELIVGTATAGLIASPTGTNAINLGATGKVTFAGLEPLLLVETGSTLTIGSALNGTATLRKERGGTLVLGGDSDQGAATQFTGAITVNQGTLRATNPKSLGASTATNAVSVNNFATLSLEAAMSITASNRPLTVAGPGVGNNGALIVTAGNTVTWGIAAGTTVVTWNTNPLIINVAGTLSLNAVVAGGATLVKIGAGNLEYAGPVANTNGAAISVNEGTLTLNKQAAVAALPGAITLTIEDLGNFDPAGSAIVAYGTAGGTNNILDTASIVINDQGQLSLGAATDIISALTVNGSRLGSDNVSTTGAGSLQVNGALTLTGGTINGTIILNNNLTYNSNNFGPTGQAIINGTLNLNNAQRTITVNDNYAVNDLVINAAISNGRLIKQGAGALALTNATNALQAGVNEIQTLTIPGAVTSFTLTFNGATSQNIATISTAAIQTALDNLLGAGNTLVTNAVSPFNVEFIGSLAGVDVAQFTSTAVGGTITHATTTGGLAGFTLSAGTLAVNATAALGGAALYVNGTAGVRPIAGAALNLASRIVLNPGAVTVLGGRRDFGGTDALTLSGPEIVTVPSAGSNYTYQVDDPLVNTTISGAIVGGALNVTNTTTSFAINKTGFGKLILSGANTFNGHVNIAAGILNLRNSLALGSGGLPQFGSPYGSFVTVNGMTALELEGGTTIANRTLILGSANPPNITPVSGYQNNFTGALRSISGTNVWRGAVDLRTDGNIRSFFIGVDAGELTIEGSIAGTTNGTTVLANNLIKIGNGTLVFNSDAPNLYTGTTAVLAGTLALSKTAGANAIAGTLVVGDNVGTNDTVEVRLPEQILNTAQVQVQSSGRFVLTSLAAVATPNEIQTITFPATLTAGTWQLDIPAAGSAGAISVTGIPFNITPSALQNRINQTYGAAAQNVTVGGIAGLIYTLSFNGVITGVDVTPVTVNTTGLTPATAPTIVETQNGGAASALPAVETINTPIFVVGSATSAQVDLVGNSILAFNGDVTVNARPGITTAVAAQITGATGRLALLPQSAAAAATRTFTVNDGSGLIELSIAAVMVDQPVPGAIAASIAKAGAGRLSLSGNNTFTGTVTVNGNGGALRVQHVNALGDTGTLTTSTVVNAGGVLEIDIAGTNTIDREQFNINGTGIINGPVTPNFTTIQGTGAIRNLQGVNSLSENSLTLMTMAGVSLVAVDAGRLIFDGALAGTSVFLKSGLGDLEFAGATENTNTGNLIINEGKLVLNKTGASRSIVGGEIFIGDGLGADNSDVLEIGALSGGNQIDDATAARVIHISKTGRFNLNGQSETLQGNMFLDVGSNMSGDIVTGAGTMTISGAAGVGNVTVLSHGGTIAASPAATIQGNYNASAVTKNFDVREGLANVELDIPAVISNGGIQKQGRGAAIISGNNTYTSVTFVALDGGTLIVNTPATVAATAYTVGANGVLGGSGTITGTVTIAASGSNLAIGGTINPGPVGVAPNNTGILTVANTVTLNSRSEFFVDLNGTTAGTGHDQLKITSPGTLTLGAGNTSVLNGATGLAMVAGTGVKVIDVVPTGAIVNQFANAVAPSPPASVNIGTRSFTYNYADNQGDPPLGNGNDFVLTSIPSTVVWDGRVDGGAVTATDDWTFAANWVGDSVPAPGDAITFNDIGIGNGKNTPFNNFPAGTTFGVITFANNSGSYAVGGNSITLNLASGGNLISNNSANVPVSNALNTPLVTATAPQTIIVKDGSTLTLGGPVTMVAAAPLTISNGTGADAAGSIVFGGTLNGAATLTISITDDATFNGAVGSVTPLTSIAITAADDVAFNSTVATSGNITQTTGTGTTTFSGGTIAGLLTITNEGLAFAGGATTVTGNTVLNATVSGIAQTAGALVTPALTLSGVGVFSLPQAGNDFNTVTATTDGAIILRDTDDLLLTGMGIVTTNDAVSLQTGTTLGLNAPVTLGTGNLTLNSGGATTQTVGIAAGGLELLGAGPYTLLLATNDITALAGNTTGIIRVNDLNGFAIAPVNGSVGLTTTANATLSSGGAVTQTAPIIGTGLELLGAGPFTLTAAGNDVATIAANATGAVSFSDANALNVGTVNSVGITTDNDNVTLSTGGPLTLTAVITAPTATVTLSPTGSIVDGNAAANNVTAGQLAVTALSGIGTLADPLETTIGGVEANGGTGGVFLVNTGALIVGGVSGALTGVAATTANINLSSTGNMTVNEPISTAGNVSLTSSGGAISNTGAAVDVAAQDLTAAAATGIDLDTNVVNVTLTTTGAGNVIIDEANALNIASLAVAGGTAAINAAGPLTNGIGTALTTSGNASFGGTTVTLGNQAGDSINVGTLAFNSAGVVNITLDIVTQLGGTSTAGSLNLTSPAAINSAAAANVNVTGAATLTAPSLNLGNQAGDVFNFGTVTFTSAGAVSISEDSSMQLVGANTAASLIVASTGALTNAAGATVNVTGNANFGGATVTIGNQAGDVINAGTLGFTSAGTVDISEDSSTQLGGTSTAGSLILTSPAGITNAAAANVNVTGNASVSSPTITLGNQAGDVLNFGTLTFAATAGGATIEENSTLSLSGTSSATGAVVLTSVDAVGTGQDLSILAGATLASTTSSVTLNAGDDAFIAGNVTSALTTTVNLDFGDAESPGVGELVAGTGGQVIITGIITTPAIGSGGGAFLNGNDDFDTFTFSPQTTTEFRVDGKAPTGTALGDSLQLDTSVTTTPVLVVPGAIAPYNGSGSGSWTFASAHQQVLFTNIEDNSPPTPFHLTFDNAVTTPISNIVIMRDASQTRVQIRNGSNTGPIVFQGLLTVVRSIRVLGSAGNDMVTVDDINTLPDFLFSVPGVTDNPSLPGAGELLFNGLGGTDTFAFNLNGSLVNQNYAVGNGVGAGSQEGELLTAGSGITLVSYFQNVEAVQRIGANATPGTSTVSGDATNNVVTIAANGVLTRTTVSGGFVPYDVNTSSIGQLIATGLDGDDTLNLVSLGSGPGNPGITLSGGNGVDMMQLQSTSGHTGPVSLVGNAGSDLFLVFDAANTVDNFIAPIIVDGSDGSLAGNDDRLTIIDSGDTTADNVIISPVDAATTQDYRIDGINSVVGNDIVFRNVDTLTYTATQGNDIIDAQFSNTNPSHDLSIATLNGWTGADQFLLFLSDQVGGTTPTPSGIASGLAVVNLNGDAPGNPNATDGNDIFGQVPPGLTGLGTGNAGLIVPDTVRMIRPSVSSSIVINGGQPTGPALPTGDNPGDSLNLDISGLPGNSALILATVSGVLATTGVQPMSYGQVEDLNLVTGNRLVNVQMGDTFVRGTSGADLIQFMRNTLPGNDNLARVRLNTLVVDFVITGKTITFAGASNDYITQANLDFPAETYGEAGDDYISGALGNDFLVGGLGADQINASGGDNIVWGDDTPSPPIDPTPQDTAVGGNDVLSALGGNDVFYGGGGDDQVSPGAGNDYLHGGAGNDILDGSQGDDRIYGGDGNDVLSGSSGNDLIVGGAGSDQLIGLDGNDILIGDTGADRLDGGAGNDLMISGSVMNDASSFTSAPITTTFDPLLYSRPTDNDAALMLLLAQWAASSNRSLLGPVIQDAQTDISLGGTGQDDFSGEASDAGAGDELF